MTPLASENLTSKAFIKHRTPRPKLNADPADRSHCEPQPKPHALQETSSAVRIYLMLPQTRLLCFNGQVLEKLRPCCAKTYERRESAFFASSPVFCVKVNSAKAPPCPRKPTAEPSRDLARSERCHHTGSCKKTAAKFETQMQLHINPHFHFSISTSTD